MAETRDPEHVKNLVDRCFERLVLDIAAFGGRVDKIVGDAILALFGAPLAHELLDRFDFLIGQDFRDDVIDAEYTEGPKT